MRHPTKLKAPRDSLAPRSTTTSDNWQSLHSSLLHFRETVMPLELNGFKAWIECDGKELEAYAVETGVNGKMISGWIASETGKVNGLLGFIYM